MTRLAYATSLGLLVTAVPLGLGAIFLQSSLEGTSQAAARSEDDRGSGRFSRVPAVAEYLGFRGSGRLEPSPPTPATAGHSPVAYRGSGRSTEPYAA
jgi:hypothetical protein